MDFTQIRNTLAMWPGITTEMMTKHYQLYFDETNNAKKFHLKDANRLNVPVGVRFVLGGVSCSNCLTQGEINDTLGLQKTSNELKFDQIYNHATWSDFAPVLKSSRLTLYLSLLEDKGALIHFSSVNLFYFALVDIIDSLEYDHRMMLGLKSILYQVATKDPVVFVDLFKTHTYPDVKDVDKFLNSLAQIINETAINNRLGKMILLDVVRSNMGRKELTFIQDEEPNVYIYNFLPIYQEIFYKFANSNIILDNEDDMMDELSNNPVEIDGNKVKYQFVDSKSEPWIQMSDVVSSLVARYFCFVESDDYDSKISEFTSRQMENLKQLNRILAMSERENKLFWHFVDDARIIDRFTKCVNKYQ